MPGYSRPAMHWREAAFHPKKLHNAARNKNWHSRGTRDRTGAREPPCSSSALAEDTGLTILPKFSDTNRSWGTGRRPLKNGRPLPQSEKPIWRRNNSGLCGKSSSAIRALSEIGCSRALFSESRRCFPVELVDRLRPRGIHYSKEGPDGSLSQRFRQAFH
jgi:hypothetical protein